MGHVLHECWLRVALFITWENCFELHCAKKSVSLWRSSEKWEAKKKPFFCCECGLSKELYVSFLHFYSLVTSHKAGIGILCVCYISLPLPTINFGSASRVMFTAKCFTSKYSPTLWDTCRYTTQLVLGLRVFFRILPIWNWLRLPWSKDFAKAKVPLPGCFKQILAFNFVGYTWLSHISILQKGCLWHRRS